MMSIRHMMRLRQAMTEERGRRQAAGHRGARIRCSPSMDPLFRHVRRDVEGIFEAMPDAGGVRVHRHQDPHKPARQGQPRPSRRDKAAELKKAAKGSCGIRVANDVLVSDRCSPSRSEFIEGQAAEVDEKIKALLDEIEPLILTIPGISYKLGAQIVAEIGDVRGRFKNAGAIVKYAG